MQRAMQHISQLTSAHLQACQSTIKAFSTLPRPEVERKIMSILRPSYIYAPREINTLLDQLFNGEHIQTYAERKLEPLHKQKRQQFTPKEDEVDSLDSGDEG